MRVLVACEFSGIVRDAFARRGHDAWSCDLLQTEQPGQHIVNDVRNILDWDWDLMIAHPPCEKMSYAGMRWFKTDPDRWRQAQEAFSFFMQMINAQIPRIAVENPRGYACQWYRKPDQIIQPYEFGHDVTKATCLWLKDLPPLFATLIHSNPAKNWTRNGRMGAHNGRNRSRTFAGIAAAMAQQWG